MIRLWRQIIKGEKGQALPIVLSFLVLGGFVIVPLLNNASTSINASRGIEENVRGIYAAEAGVEEALWSIRNSVPSLEKQLPENINRMQVEILTDDKGPYTLAYYDKIIESGTHGDWIVISGDMVPEGEVYKYTITVSLDLEQTTQTVHLEEVGVRLPVGYEYVTDSAYDFVENLSTDEPFDTQDYADAHMLSWELPPPRPSISGTEPTKTQIFYVDGEGEVQGDYTWIEAAEEDIGKVGEVTGTLFRITSIARSLQDSEIEARIIADVIYDEGTGETRIIYWQVSPQ